MDDRFGYVIALIKKATNRLKGSRFDVQKTRRGGNEGVEITIWIPSDPKST